MSQAQSDQFLFLQKGSLSGGARLVSTRRERHPINRGEAAHRITPACNRVLAGLAIAGGVLLFAANSMGGTVTAVGLNNFNQATPPATLSPDVRLSAGREFSLALNSDGTVVGWGNSGEGRSTPPSGLAGALAISAGSYHSLAVKADGTISGWGYGANGLLDIPANLQSVVSVAAGSYHSLALQRDGTVVAWGYVGNGRATPPSNLRDVVAIGAGRDFSVALKSDGTVVAWGLDDQGQTDVPAGLAKVVAISVGANHTLALKSDGTVAAWGLNDAGQTTVPAGLANVVAIAAGEQHSLALKTDGTVQGWGDNSSNQLNVNGSDIRAIAAGGYDSLALHGTGPLITTQPHGQTSLAGSSITLSVGATGSGLAYQWQLNGKDIAGATGSTLTLNNATRSTAGIYTVRVTSANGSTISQNTVVVVRGHLRAMLPQRLPGGSMRCFFKDEFGDPISAANLGRYQAQVSTDLQSWTPFSQPLSLQNGQIQVDDPAAPQYVHRFYRVGEQ